MSGSKKMPRKVRGGRAFFFADPAVDKVLNMVVTLASEVWVLRERLSALELVGERNRAWKVDDVNAYEFTSEQEARLAEVRTEFIGNLFRILEEPSANAAAKKPRAKSSKSASKVAPRRHAKPTRAAKTVRAKGARRR